MGRAFIIRGLAGAAMAVACVHALPMAAGRDHGAAVTAMLAEQDGVRCPSGFSARISEGERRLVCIKVGEFQLSSHCGPRGFPGVAVLRMDVKGQDSCLYVDKVVQPSTMPRVMPPWYPPATRFRRVVVEHDADRFVADDYAFPERLPPYGGSAMEGVRCPSGWSGESRFNGNGIRCVRNDGSPKEADCDFGWTVDRDRLGQEDRCVGINEGPTKPMGMTKIAFDAERALGTVAWYLDKRSGTDLWQKRVFTHPSAVE
jgi:hypothetical protein